jgi:hypothetical protein
MKIIKIKTYRDREHRRLPKADISLNPTIIRAGQALNQAQERVDRLNSKQLDTSTRQVLGQMQILFHEALAIIVADD